MTKHSPPYFAWCLLGLLTSSGAICGCGSSPEPVPAAATPNIEPKAPAEPKSPKGADPKPAKTGTAQKMVDGIPYDVFFDKPLVVASNSQTGAAVAANASATTPDNKTATPPPTSENAGTKESAATSGAGGLSLKDLIDQESLANEIKNVRNYLAGKVASPAAYNSSYLEMPPEAATLAVLAVAVAKYPEEFSWKKNAKHVRDLAAQIVEVTTSKDAKTKNSFDAVSEAFLKIDDILKGTEPAGLPDAEEDKSFGDAVGGNTVLLMKRIGKSETMLKSTINSEAALKKEVDHVAQEGALLAFMAGIITAPGFGWDGDAEFANYAKPLAEGGKQLIEAAKSGNYALYGEAMTKVSKSCNDCHPKFKP